MANLIKGFHPHHQSDIKTFKDLYKWIEYFFENKYTLYKKWDGISSSISLNPLTKELGIKRSIAKLPLDKEYVQKYFYNKEEALYAFTNLIQIVNKNKSIFNILKLNLNPNLILLIEYIKPDLNIISYEEECYNIIGLAKIKGSILTPELIDNSIYEYICSLLNKASDIKFVYNNNLELDISMYKKKFFDLLKQTNTIKNIKSQQTLYDILCSNNTINKRYKNVYKKVINTSSISYYNKEGIDFCWGIAATEIIVQLGEFIKKITMSEDVEGFIFYDQRKQIYLKLVGNFIKNLDKSNFKSKKKFMPFMLG